MKYRIEKDTLGEVEVPADVYYGPQTQRSVNNFKIATDISRMPEEVIEAFAYLKKGAALANKDAGVLSPEKCELIGKVCDEILAGKLNDSFPLIQFQTEEKTKSRSTSLRSTLNLGAEYTLLNNKLGFGLLSSTQFTQPKAYSELTLSANYRPRNWFGATLSYSFLHSDFETLGIGLKLGPVFIGSDYLMTKSAGDANRVNAYLGVSVPLGKKRLDYRR